MGNIPFRLPSGTFQTIPQPVNQILEATPTAMVAKDGLYFKLRLSLNNDRIGGQLLTAIT